MFRPHPTRFFRSATALGVLAVGLALPAVAVADPADPSAPLVTPRFKYGPAVDAGYGPVVSVLHGRFAPGPGQQIAAVADSGLNANGVGTAAGVAVFGATATGYERTHWMELFGAQPIAAVAGQLEADGGDSVVVASFNGQDGVVESVTWRDGEHRRFTQLPHAPVAVAVGRFLPGFGPVVAVSTEGDHLEFLAPDGTNDLKSVLSITAPTGPLGVTTRPDGTGDVLVRPKGTGGVRLEFNAFTLAAREVGDDLLRPFGLSNGAVASEADPYGNRWYATNVDGTGELHWFSKDGENGGYLASPAELGAPMVMNLYGGQERDVVGALDGHAFRAVQVSTDRTAQTGIDSSRIATALDIDADRRDDLVVADGTAVRLYGNDTGTFENSPELEAHRLVPSVYDSTTGRQVVTSRTFDFAVPKDTNDRYQCRIGDGDWVDCVSAVAGARALSVDANGSYKLLVRRMAAGTDFWSAPQSIGFRVEAATEKPTIVEAPAAVTRAAKFRITPPAGTRVEYRVDNDPQWQPTAISADGDVYLGFTNLLQDGTHKVTFRAVDASSDTPSETVVSTFELDTKAPRAPKKIFGPESETTARKATFAFEGENGGSFECRLDPRNADRVGARTIDAWEPCLDTFSVTDLELGEHVVEVRQTDAAGNHGAPAAWIWTVVPPTPDVVVTPGPSTPDVVVTPAPSTPEAPTKDAAPTPAAEKPAPSPAVPAKTADPQPQPAKAADPKPVAAKLSVGVPAGKGQTPTATSTGRRVAVGCAAPGAEGYRCAVTVTRGGKQVGAGRRTGAGVVPVNLDKATARKVQRLGGLKVRVTLTVKTADGETSKTQKTVRLLPKKVLVVPTDGLFAFDSAKPSKGADALAKQIAGQLDGARTITIVGHTDAKGTADVNRRLGQQRAEAFRRLLARHGFDGKVAVESAGDTQPRASNATDGGRELNRRVEIEVRY